MRLIDADKLKKTIADPLNSAYGVDCTEYTRKLIDQSPTIDLWHYPSKGELPDKDGEYLCRYLCKHYKHNLRFTKVSHYRVKDNKWYQLIYDKEHRVPKPDAWQYIIPPKEEE